jgi:hypothetical protein
MGKIAEQIGSQVERLEESTLALSRFIGTIVKSLGGTVTINKEELKAVMESEDWHLDVQEPVEGKVMFVFVENKKGLLS